MKSAEEWGESKVKCPECGHGMWMDKAELVALIREAQSDAIKAAAEKCEYVYSIPKVKLSAWAQSAASCRDGILSLLPKD